jgi:hypothetical protein
VVFLRSWFEWVNEFPSSIALRASLSLGPRSISTEERAALQGVAREIAEAHAEAARTSTESASVVTFPV